MDTESTKQLQLVRGDCYKCHHSEAIPGDSHLKCNAISDDTLQWQVLSLLFRRPELAMPILARDLGVAIDPHGYIMGWACWPMNFDPIWVKCYLLHQLPKLTKKGSGEPPIPDASPSV